MQVVAVGEESLVAVRVEPELFFPPRLSFYNLMYLIFWGFHLTNVHSGRISQVGADLNLRRSWTRRACKYSYLRCPCNGCKSSLMWDACYYYIVWLVGMEMEWNTSVYIALFFQDWIGCDEWLRSGNLFIILNPIINISNNEKIFWSSYPLPPPL